MKIISPLISYGNFTIHQKLYTKQSQPVPDDSTAICMLLAPPKTELPMLERNCSCTSIYVLNWSKMVVLIVNST